MVFGRKLWRIIVLTIIRMIFDFNPDWMEVESRPYHDPGAFDRRTRLIFQGSSAFFVRDRGGEQGVFMVFMRRSLIIITIAPPKGRHAGPDDGSSRGGFSDNHIETEFGRLKVETLSHCQHKDKRWRVRDESDQSSHRQTEPPPGGPMTYDRDRNPPENDQKNRFEQKGEETDEVDTKVHPEQEEPGHQPETQPG